MRLEIKTVITVEDDISGDTIEEIRDEFMELAWDHDCSVYQPKVDIVELQIDAIMKGDIKH